MDIDYEADKHSNEKSAGFTVLQIHKQLKKTQLRKRNRLRVVISDRLSAKASDELIKMTYNNALEIKHIKNPVSQSRLHRIYLFIIFYMRFLTAFICCSIEAIVSEYL